MAVQIELDGDHLRVLKIVAGEGGNYLETFSLDGAVIASTSRGIEFRIAGETGIIGIGGELIITHDTQRFILKPAVKEALQ